MSKPVHYNADNFPPKNLEWGPLIPLIGDARAEIARFDGTLHAIPNPEVLLSPLTTREAVLSSKIEGTQATMEEVLEYEAGASDKDIHPEKEADINEIRNYRQSLSFAISNLSKLSLSRRLLCDTHKVLLAGVRGKNKDPGNFRRVPNWIGPDDRPIEEASYVPISAGNLDDGISRWEKYLHAPSLDPLVQLAVAHAEFEALHPFLDGNGRLGRILVPLYLFDRKLLKSPTFYISEYLEEKKEEYYARLFAVSRDGDWLGWCKFFLTAVVEQARTNTGKAIAILDLYESKKKLVGIEMRSSHAIHAIDFIFKFPIFTSSRFLKDAGAPRMTAHRLLKLMKEKKLIVTLRHSSGSRPELLCFIELMLIAEGHPTITPQ